jgi:hypothetical protein
MDRSQTGIITQDIKQVVQASGVVYSFIHVSRSSNEVTHVLEFLWPYVCNDCLNQ